MVVLQRREDLILSGGENIYPAEVEDAYCGHTRPGGEGGGGCRRSQMRKWGQSVSLRLIQHVFGRFDELTHEAHCQPLLARAAWLRYKIPRADPSHQMPMPAHIASGKIISGAKRSAYLFDD